MRATYTVIQRPADGLRIVERYDMIRGETGQALWTLVKLRKQTTCAATGAALAKGDQAWSPVGNQSYRYERLAEGELT